MKMRKIKLLGLFIIPLLLIDFCSCSSSGENKNKNPFDNSGTSPIVAEYSSNADTVFLSWKLQGDIDFDSYTVKDQDGRNELKLGSDETSCYLTHIPYNQNYKITVSLISGGAVKTYSDVIVNINGFDSTIASKIMPDNGSVTEGDGMYSIDLGDDRSIFLMGDSYTGVVSNGRRISGSHMYRNTYSVYNQKTGKSYAICEENGTNTSAIVPEGVTDESTKWYWPGHGFVVGDKLYIFQLLMHTGEGAEGWNFHYEDTHIIQYGLPEINVMPEKIAEIPYNVSVPSTPSQETPEIHFGAAALNDLNSTGYLYIYAQVDVENDLDPIAEVYVARTTPDKLFTSWEYYDGSNWSSSQNSVKALTGLESVPISSQFNVFKLDGKYVLLAQNKTFNSGEIYTFTSDNPWGPWGNKTLIYKIPDLGNDNWFTYNAMGHPQIQKDGMILVTFNVNTSDFSEQSSDVSSYRPRFFWIEKTSILK